MRNFSTYSGGQKRAVFLGVAAVFWGVLVSGCGAAVRSLQAPAPRAESENPSARTTSVPSLDAAWRSLQESLEVRTEDPARPGFPDFSTQQEPRDRRESRESRERDDAQATAAAETTPLIDQERVEFPGTYSVPRSYLVWPARAGMVAPEASPASSPARSQDSPSNSQEGLNMQPLLIQEGVYSRAIQDERNQRIAFPERQMARLTEDRAHWFIPLEDLIQGPVSEATPLRRYLVLLELRTPQGEARVLEVGLRLQGPLPQLRSLNFFAPRTQPRSENAAEWSRLLKQESVQVGQEVLRNPSQTKRLRVSIRASGKFQLGAVQSCTDYHGGAIDREIQAREVRSLVRSFAYLSRVTLGSLESGAERPAEKVLEPGESVEVGYWAKLGPELHLTASVRERVGACRCPEFWLRGETLAGNWTREVRWSDASDSRPVDGPAGREGDRGPSESLPGVSVPLEWVWGASTRNLPGSSCQGFYST